MALFEINWTKSAVKDIAEVPKKDRLKIIDKIKNLKDDPCPPGSVKLEGSQNSWRIRQGNFRVVYQVDSNVLTILVIKIAHRKEVYK